jgi:hypothetical protein
MSLQGSGTPWHSQETYKGLITLGIECSKLLALANGGAAGRKLGASSLGE